MFFSRGRTGVFCREHGTPPGAYSATCRLAQQHPRGLPREGPRGAARHRRPSTSPARLCSGRASPRVARLARHYIDNVQSVLLFPVALADHSLWDVIHHATRGFLLRYKLLALRPCSHSLELAQLPQRPRTTRDPRPTPHNSDVVMHYIGPN